MMMMIRASYLEETNAKSKKLCLCQMIFRKLMYKCKASARIYNGIQEIIIYKIEWINALRLDWNWIRNNLLLLGSIDIKFIYYFVWVHILKYKGGQFINMNY